MTNGSQRSTRLVLSDQKTLGRITVEMEAFFEFSFGLAEDIDDLVQRWAPKAAVIPQKRTRKSVPR